MGCNAAGRGKMRIPHRPGGSPVRTHNNAARLAVASSKCALDSHHQECRTVSMSPWVLPISVWPAGSEGYVRMLESRCTR